MTEAQAIEIIAAQFLAQWPTLTAAIAGAPVGGYPFAIDNEAFKAQDTFAFLTWQPTTSQQMTMGSPNRKRHYLVIMVKLWSPVNQGAAALAGLADICRRIFQSQTLGTGDGVTVQAGTTSRKTTDGSWTMCMVTFPAFYDEVS